MGGKGASEGRVSAKERKASAQREKDAAAKKAAEDREWAEAQGPKVPAWLARPRPRQCGKRFGP
eukprot:scaffold8119_cov444-Prasinococcus_capsulatus_cf.AAC.2